MLIGQHMTRMELDKKFLRRRLSRLGPEMLDKLLRLQQADMDSKGVCKDSEKAQFAQVLSLLAQIQEESTCLTLKDLAVDGNDLMALGFQGKAIGVCLKVCQDFGAK